MISQSVRSLGFILTVTYHFFLKGLPAEPAYLPELKLCLILLVETVSQCCLEPLDTVLTEVQESAVHTKRGPSVNNVIILKAQVRWFIQEHQL